MYDPRPPRAVSATLAVGLCGLLVALLVAGLRVVTPPVRLPALVSMDLAHAPVPPPPVPPQRPERPDSRKAAPKDDAGARNLRNRATAIVAPPILPMIEPPPVASAPVANVGAAVQTGASDRPGPGQGAGHSGDGLGGGGTGGDGDGSGGGEAVRGPRRIAGAIRYGDLPEDALAIGDEAQLVVVFAVERDGRVTGCRVEDGSGHPGIDALTCRLIESRFHYRPALDRSGRPVRAFMRETHSWFARPQN